MNRVFSAVAFAVLASSAFAQSSGMKGMEMKDMPMMKSDVKAGEVHQGTGTVRSVDAAKGTVNLAHEPIPSLKWPSMNMTFKVKEKSMVEKLKPGQKVEFSFVQSGKDYVINDIK
jgi:Cu(I)/Ag(I) efflux system protein CusF